MNRFSDLPFFICGPIIRRLTRDRIVIWWISPKPVKCRFSYHLPDKTTFYISLDLIRKNLKRFQFGENAWVHLADIAPDQHLPLDQKIDYNLEIETEEDLVPATKLIPDITYPGEQRPSFVVRKSVKRFFHGSCRKPHFDGKDAFIGLDREIEHSINDIDIRPAFLMLTGDQVYADDVAGPMLQAIHQVINRLGLYREEFDEAVVKNSDDLYTNSNCYYRRKKILPRTKVGNYLFLRGGAKHIFSSGSAHNHLITFAEWMAMYVLVWSPSMWEYVNFDICEIPVKYRKKYEKELKIIRMFIETLPQVRRLLAHIPAYMVFDDHDITDDWNLTVKWEQQAYGHPFTKRIIGNGLIAYFLCQGWGNAPDKFSPDFLGIAGNYFESPEKTNHDKLVDLLIGFKQWHYEVPLFPPLIVVDSRTRRWKRDTRISSPSGLLDWEALMKLQHKMMQEDSVLLVAPGPIFGVKIIELIQRIFTAFGYSLAVDAENWMTHKKSATVLLEIFKNAKTASYTVIISGDVHYSFVYDVELRYTSNCPGIWQITSSGIKNEFPNALLKALDRINQVMFSPFSLLNRFTKRKDLVIYERVPAGRKKQRLISTCGIGRVTLDEKGAPVEIAEVFPDAPPLLFEPTDKRRK